MGSVPEHVLTLARTWVRESGEIVAFRSGQVDFPTSPENAFYDWLYLEAFVATKKTSMLEDLHHFAGFIEIEFNPKRSNTCT